MPVLFYRKCSSRLRARWGFILTVHSEGQRAYMWASTMNAFPNLGKIG